MSFIRRLTAFFYPERCPYCGTLIEACRIACPNCLEDIKSRHKPIRGGARGFRCLSTFVYDGRVRRMILRMKYHDRVQYIPQIAVILSADIKAEYGDSAFDLITCVPMYHSDLRQREYNQSALLAKELADQLGIPYQPTLQKVKKTKKQHRLTYRERKNNLSGAFKLIDKEIVKGKRLLIVDDIITSGFTLGNCCRVLSRAHPALLCCATIASARQPYPDKTVI